MQNNNQQQDPFWNFIQSFNPDQARETGRGVDHQPGAGASTSSGFPFDPAHFQGWAGPGAWGGPWGGHYGSGGPWGHGRHARGWHGRPAHGDESDREEPRDSRGDAQAEGSPETMREEHDGPPGPPGPPPPQPPHHSHPGGQPFGPGPHRRPGSCGRGRGRGRGGHRGHRGHHGPPPPQDGPFDFRPIMQAFANHPFAQTLRDYIDQAASGQTREQTDGTDETFTPPVDIFNTEKAYVLHVALPGASKEDVGVHWDPEKKSLNIAGVVYRPGNEDFLQTLASSERIVGMFERSIKLPPAGSDDTDDLDGFAITAKMENGILVVTVPKAEKEWTEIHKIDIE